MQGLRSGNLLQATITIADLCWNDHAMGHAVPVVVCKKTEGRGGVNSKLVMSLLVSKGLIWSDMVWFFVCLLTCDL